MDSTPTALKFDELSTLWIGNSMTINQMLKN